jgi:hypothetical protein
MTSSGERRRATRRIVWLLACLCAFAATTTSVASAGVVYVGDYGSSEIRRFDDTGASISPVPWATGLQTEGLATLQNAVGPWGSNLVYAGNYSGSTVEILNANATTNPVVNANFITGLQGVANLALSNNGQILYVAQEITGLISEYNSITGAFIKSVAFAGAHDVYVGPDGSVYAAAYGSSSPPSQGVWKFHADLTGGAQFINLNDHGLSKATGMAFDNSGNFWVANAGTVNGGGGTDFVSEYSIKNGNVKFVQKISNDASNHLLNVFGLTKAVDGNLYAASLGTGVGTADGSITKINVLTAAVSTFIAAGTAAGDAGTSPKYATSSADTVTYQLSPEPSSLVLLGMGVTSLSVSTWFRRRKKARMKRVNHRGTEDTEYENTIKSKVMKF